MQAVNLLPRQLAVAPGKSLQPLALVGAAAVPVIAILLVVIGYSSATSTVAAEKAKFTALQAKIAALGGVAPAVTPKTTTDAATVAQWNALITQRTARRTELDGILSQQLPWDSMMRDSARILPDDVWLTALMFQSPVAFAAGATTASATPGAAATNFSISGFGESEKSIALLLVRLRLLPILSNVSLGTTSSTTLGSKTLVQFTVTATITPPVATGALPVPGVPATTTTPPATP